MAPKCLRTLQNMIRRLLLLPIIGLSLMLAACTSHYQSGKQTVTNGPLFTIEGWEVLPTPRGGYVPGTIFSVDQNGNTSIEKYLFQPPVGRDENKPFLTPKLRQRTRINIDANGSVLGTTVQGQHFFEADAELNIPGSRVVFRSYDQMNGTLRNWLLKARSELLPTRKYCLIEECLVTKELDFNLEATDRNLLSLEAIAYKIGGSISASGENRKLARLTYRGNEPIVVAIKYRQIELQSPASDQPMR
jgi:hypothetical protein